MKKSCAHRVVPMQADDSKDIDTSKAYLNVVPMQVGMIPYYRDFGRSRQRSPYVGGDDSKMCGAYGLNLQ